MATTRRTATRNSRARPLFEDPSPSWETQKRRFRNPATKKYRESRTSDPVGSAIRVRAEPVLNASIWVMGDNHPRLRRRRSLGAGDGTDCGQSRNGDSVALLDSKWQREPTEAAVRRLAAASRQNVHAPQAPPCGSVIEKNKKNGKYAGVQYRFAKRKSQDQKCLRSAPAEETTGIIPPTSGTRTPGATFGDEPAVASSEVVLVDQAAQHFSREKTRTF
jgi:hypothetical protein